MVPCSTLMLEVAQERIQEIGGSGSMSLGGADPKGRVEVSSRLF